MKKMIFVFLLVFLIFSLFFQGKVEVIKVSKEEPKKTTWTKGQIAEFQKELDLIQKNEKSYAWTDDVPYKEIQSYHDFEKYSLIKPDLVPPGSSVISELNDIRIPQPDPQFLPNAIPGENKSTLIPIEPLIHDYQWLSSQIAKKKLILE